uniref:HAT C-terminal dimerisation domain-containing protein n=2 Tax=Aegilops tauschii subsp. strangulata TaxID=200361 RepID=A0A453FGF4_AEGTS
VYSAAGSQGRRHPQSAAPSPPIPAEARELPSPQGPQLRSAIPSDRSFSSARVATVGADQECGGPNPDCCGTDEDERMVNGVEHAAGNANNEQDESTDSAPSPLLLGAKPKKRLTSKCSPGIQTQKRQKNQEAIQNGSHEEPAAPEQKNLALPVLSTDQNKKNQGTDQNISREELVRIFAMHGHASRMVEQGDFWKLLTDLNPAVKIPSRFDLKNETFDLFDQEKAKLREKLTALPCRVCLSAYVWHYSPLQAFLCLTVHYIDDEWEKQKKIIKFSPVDPSCSQEELSHIILRAIGEWGLDDKVFSTILDDAFIDDSVASNVKTSLQKRNKVAANRSLFVARYATHLLDEVIQVGLDELDTIIENTSKCSKMHPTPSLAHYHKRRYASADDWKKAQKICKYLQDFNRYKDSVHKSPIPDKVFDKVWNVKEKVLRNTGIDRFKTLAEVFLRDKEEEGISVMRRNMEKKFKKRWKVCFLQFCMPMVMDPKYHLEHIKSRIQAFTVQSAYTVDGDIDDFICEVHDTLLNLYGEYSDQAQEPDCTSWSKIWMGEFIGRDILHELYLCSEYPYRQRPLTELDDYLQEAQLLPAGESSVLQWWKEHSLTYPSIGRMARDILALPCRTDCKAATRTAKLVMSESGNKNRVESLVCIQDWLAPAGNTTSVESNLQN